MSEEVGALQRFEVLERIGGGAHGHVHRGRDPSLGRFVALKFLTVSSAAQLSLLAQAQAQARVVHPHVVPVFALGRAPHPDTAVEAACVVMELVGGARTIRQWVSGPAISVGDATRVALEIADGLAAIHASGLTHGDLHDKNVLIDAAGHARIIDIYYLESLAQGSTATRASLIAKDIEFVAYLVRMIFNKAGIDVRLVEDLYDNGAAATDLASFRALLDAACAAIRGSPSPLRVQRIHAAADTFRAALDSFRSKRLEAIRSDSAYLKFGVAPLVVMHVGAASSLGAATDVDVTTLRDTPDHQALNLHPLFRGGWDDRANFDGRLMYAERRNSHEAQSYVQVFRTGIVEYVADGHVRERSLLLAAIGPEAFRGLTEGVRLLWAAKLPRPYFVALTLLRTRGLSPSVGSGFEFGLHPCDVDEMVLPTVILDDHADAASALHSSMNRIAQAFGAERALGFNHTGAYHREVPRFPWAA